MKQGLERVTGNSEQVEGGRHGLVRIQGSIFLVDVLGVRPFWSGVEDGGRRTAGSERLLTPIKHIVK